MAAESPLGSATIELDLVARIEGGRVFGASAASRMLGVEPAELEGVRFIELVHPGDRLGVDIALAVREHSVPAAFRCRHAASRDWVWLEATFSPLETGVLLIARDISSRKRVEDALLVAQKMEAVVRLAGGVAHDFNNILSVVLSAAALLAEEVPADSLAAEMAQEISRGCRRASELTRQLVAFSGRQLLQAHPVDLKDVVAAVCARTSGRVEVGGLPDEATITLADAAQLESVLAELLDNARDAMPNGGAVTVALRRFDVSAEWALRDGLPPGAWLALSVRDEGCGIDAAVQPHLFEPFFTTKPRGKGTGLGLATAWGVVTQFKGYLRVESEPGAGATFTVLLPACREKPDAPIASPPPTVQTGQTVLLVEDDASVRWIAAEVLQRSGFTVLQAESGAQAVGIAQRGDVAVDLLLTDVVMPNLSGPEVAKAVTALQPGARVLFMSGYTNDASLRASIRDSAVQFLPKPFSPESLAQRVREALTADPPRTS